MSFVPDSHIRKLRHRTLPTIAGDERKQVSSRCVIVTASETPHR
jgi:hypothetical protein